MEFLIEHISCNFGGRRYGVSRLKVGEWFTIVCKDRDGAGPADHFLPLSKLTTDYLSLLELLK